MKRAQLLANIGDVNPVEYGGTMIFTVDGEIECHHLHIHYDEEPNYATVSRFNVDKCTYENGILSDNEFHKDNPAWFAKNLPSMTDDVDALIKYLCSDNPIERALGYDMIACYFGYENLGACDYTYSTRFKLHAEYGRLV